MNHRLSLFLFLSFLSCQILRAQVKTDTLTISLPDAEKIFFEKNLTLLAYGEGGICGPLQKGK